MSVCALNNFITSKESSRVVQKLVVTV